MLRAIIRFSPAVPKKGDLVEVRSRVRHPMETGHRRDLNGRAVPRDILNRLTVTYGGQTVLEAEMFPAVAANPFIAFKLRAGESGPVTFTWTGDDGKSESASAQLTVG
jgi:sulfur-oxidizing protein SoxZ